MLQLELEQWRRKAFVDRHRWGNEKEFEVGKPVLLFQTRMGNMPEKLRFRWTGPFWITKEYNGSYQLGTLAGEVIGKWANGFRLKPYKGCMSANPSKGTRNRTIRRTGKKRPRYRKEPIWRTGKKRSRYQREPIRLQPTSDVINFEEKKGEKLKHK